MDFGLFLIILAGISIGTYSFFQKKASAKISPPLANFFIAISTLITSLLTIFLWQKGKQKFLLTKEGIIFAVLIGIFATGIDLFAIWGYSKGVSLSVGGPLITATGIVLTLIYGLISGEPLTFYKILAVSLILIGAMMLGRLG